ncbi:hypothetical protein Osc1_10040 [Hominimerdicola sp. 21CYCFAH17_S]
MKKFFSLIIVVCIGYICPITSYASFDIPNKYYLGIYDNLSNQLSYIDINNSGYCNVSIVYSPLEKQFLTATRGAGYINNKRFYAEFSSYIIKKSNGSTVRVVNQETYFSGTVDLEDDYIDVIVGGIIYERER